MSHKVSQLTVLFKLALALIARQSVATELLAWGRTDRPSTPSHRSPPECFRNYRSPLTTALTDNILGAFATTDNPQTTASTDHFLGAFGQTGNPEERVQRPDAEPAND